MADIILQFLTSDTDIVSGSVEACITGLTTGDESIVGCDAINVIGGN